MCMVLLTRQIRINICIKCMQDRCYHLPFIFAGFFLSYTYTHFNIMDERRLKSWHHIIYYYATACFSSIYTCTTQCFGHPRSTSTYFLRLNTCWQPKTKKYCFVFWFWCAIYRIGITTKKLYKKILPPPFL